MKNGTNRYFFNSTVSFITKFLPGNDEKSLSLSPGIELNYKFGIHLIPKWRAINYFGCVLISRLCLNLTSKFFCVLYMLTRQRGLVNMQTKE